MQNLTKKPVIGITMGDPVGVGPEVIVRALEERAVWKCCMPLIFGDSGVMERALKLLHSTLELHTIPEAASDYLKENRVNVLPLSHLDMDHFSYGKPTAQTGNAMVAYIKKAARLAMAKKIDGIVTGPINKAAMTLAGYAYPGHTELLAEETKTDAYAMMLAGEKLKVILVTIHEPLRTVSEILTEEKILSTLRLSHENLREYFGIPQPNLAVAALNPHAGEGGRFGQEEQEIIMPAIDKAKREGIHASGPFPADSLFFYALKGRFDAVICMYHDQGLIPLKLVHFEDAVNVTLGLPIIRTSVDHGTAYDIVGTGTAIPKSMINAVRMASKMALNKKIQ